MPDTADGRTAEVELHLELSFVPSRYSLEVHVAGRQISAGRESPNGAFGARRELSSRAAATIWTAGIL